MRRVSVLLACGGAALAMCAVTYFTGTAWPVFAQTSAGQQLFERRCTGCHALDREIAGPRLRGVYGRRAASVPAFPYSESLRKSSITWDSNSLNKWLTDPEAFIPDNDMAFRVVNPEERSAIIDYLKDLSRK